MLFINFDKTLSFKGEKLQTVFLFFLDLEIIENIQYYLEKKKSQFRNFFPRQVVITNALLIFISKFVWIAKIKLFYRQNDACRKTDILRRQNV